MAYSRFNNSLWYTFWSVNPVGEECTRDSAIFEIYGVCRLTAKELRDDLDGCMQIIRTQATRFSRDWQEELKKYIGYFLADVDQRFATVNRQPLGPCPKCRHINHDAMLFPWKPGWISCGRCDYEKYVG